MCANTNHKQVELCGLAALQLYLFTASPITPAQLLLVKCLIVLSLWIVRRQDYDSSKKSQQKRLQAAFHYNIVRHFETLLKQMFWSLIQVFAVLLSREVKR